MRIVSLKLPAALDRQLDELARTRKVSRSAVLREALEIMATAGRRTVSAAAADLAGSLSGPRDLSSAAKRMARYGK